MNSQHSNPDRRLAVLADPRRVSPELEAAFADDAELLALRQQVLRGSDQLAKAFGDVAAPAGLADRIILRVRYRQRSKWLVGIAASVLVAIIAIGSLRTDAPPPIALAMLKHVVEEAGELADDGQVSAATTQASMQRIGVRFNDLGYRIRHLAECVVDGRTGRHLVINTPDGLVSFLIMPQTGREMPGRVELANSGFQAVLRPADGVAIGVFADKRISIGAMEAIMHKTFFADAVGA